MNSSGLLISHRKIHKNCIFRFSPKIFFIYLKTGTLKKTKKTHFCRKRSCMSKRVFSFVNKYNYKIYITVSAVELSVGFQKYIRLAFFHSYHSFKGLWYQWSAVTVAWSLRALRWQCSFFFCLRNWKRAEIAAEVRNTFCWVISLEVNWGKGRCVTLLIIHSIQFQKLIEILS